MNLLKITLKQETPMIHFESHLKDATLRATELKPKIDKFIINELENVDQQLYNEYVNTIKENNFNNGKISPYKVNINTNLDSRTDIKKEEFYKSSTAYFGNMSNNTKKMNAIITDSDIYLTFFSFKEDIINLIKEVIPYVFAYNNFGTRQNKGFGCFTPIHFKRDNGSTEKYNFELKKLLPKKSLTFSRKIKYRRNNDFNELEEINKDYNKILSYIKERDKDHLVDELRIIRPLFGLINKGKFKYDKKMNKKYFDLEINGIDRITSPLTFKVQGNNIYIISEKIPNELFGKNVKLKPKYDNENLLLPTLPSKDEFNLEEFMRKAIGFINEVNKHDKNNYTEVK